MKSSLSCHNRQDSRAQLQRCSQVGIAIASWPGDSGLSGSIVKEAVGTSAALPWGSLYYSH